jgi:hypothetical protein
MRLPRRRLSVFGAPFLGLMAQRGPNVRGHLDAARLAAADMGPPRRVACVR